MIGARYAIAVIRFLVDFSSKEDVRQVHALQDAMKLSQGRPGTFEIPNWNLASLKKSSSCAPAAWNHGFQYAAHVWRQRKSG
jgi:hypothetical protein